MQGWILNPVGSLKCRNGGAYRFLRDWRVLSISITTTITAAVSTIYPVGVSGESPAYSHQRRFRLLQVAFVQEYVIGNGVACLREMLFLPVHIGGPYRVAYPIL